MSTHITVVPASTQAGKETIRVLLQSESKPFVRGIYRDPSKAPSEFLKNTQFEAVKGDVGTGVGLDFQGSDAVFYIPPPTYDGTDQSEWATRTATNVENAIQASPSVKRLLLFSAVGSQYDHSIGILRLNHISDTILNDAAPEVLIIRPGYFYEGWRNELQAAKGDSPVIYSWMTPADYKVPMVSLKDIGECCASSLLSKSAKPSPYYFKLFGPRHYSSIDLKKAMEDVTGKEVELKLVEKDQLAEFFAQQIPEAHVQDFVGMATAVLPGGIMSGDFGYGEDTVRGKVELVDAFRQLYEK